MAARGGTLALGRRLPALLQGVGLAEIGAEAFFPVVHPSLAALERLTYAQVGPGLVADGRATEAEIAAHLDNVARGIVHPLMAPLFTAWGARHQSS
jgi:hypothetical protein